MRFLWLFAIFWCGISFTMARAAWLSAAPPYALAFVGLFVLIGVGLVAFLIKSYYERWRVGKTQLHVRSGAVSAGERVTLEFQVERDDLGGQRVKFELLGQEDDDGWTTMHTMTQTATIHAALRNATARLMLPDEARASSASWRWLATAALEKYPKAVAKHVVEVLADPQAGAASVDSVVLGADHHVTPPPGAQAISPGVWTWRIRSRLLQGIGLVMMVFALFWLWNTADFAVPPMNNEGGITANFMGLAIMLFGVPFWIGGFVMLGLGLLMLTFSQRATVRAGEVEMVAYALGKAFATETLRASDINRLQATNAASSGSTVLRFGLAAHTDQGAVDLPFSASSTDELARQAHWLCQMLGLHHIEFDPRVISRDVRKRSNRSADLVRSSISHWLKRVMGVSIACAVVAFLGIFVGVATGWIR